MSDHPWYKDGLRFECTQCGACCSGEPGYVWVTSEEIRKIAEFLGREDGWLSKRELRRVRLSYSLTELPNGDCVFLQWADGKAMCAIYSVRPVQCCTFPFWQHNVKSARNWEQLGKWCPGVNRGRLYDFEQIEQRRRNRW
ncbi:MAG TPA: YkgJ family cysteine cluster protein [Phycisphaerae bacterium]|nr:YkgJ family cysteine cluster protein [Phycisphaerae bacterium]